VPISTSSSSVGREFIPESGGAATGKECMHQTSLKMDGHQDRQLG